MNTKFTLIIITLIFLSACTRGGYNRSYIISESIEEEKVIEPQENRG